MLLAGCAVMDEKGRILIVHRSTPDLTQWEMPGGKVELGEQPADAAVREIKEELGVDVEVMDMLGTTRFDFRGIPCEYHYFRAKIVNGKPAIQEAKHDDWAYVDINSPDPRFSHGINGLKKVFNG